MCLYNSPLKLPGWLTGVTHPETLPLQVNIHRKGTSEMITGDLSFLFLLFPSLPFSLLSSSFLPPPPSPSSLLSPSSFFFKK